MTDKQPEALRLADALDEKWHRWKDDPTDELKAAAELRRLHSVEKAFQQWITKTEWVQKSSQSHELGIHRADVMKQRLDQLLTENQQLRAALDKPQSDQPVMTPIAQRKLDSLLTEGYTISGYSIYHERKHQHGFVTGAGLVGWWKPDGVEYPQPQGEQEPTPNGATHRQPKQGAFYKRVDGKWYVWSRMENGGSHRWYISPGTTESCLDPLYTHPQPPRQPLTVGQINRLIADGKLPLSGNPYEVARAIERTHGIGGEA